MELRDWTDHQRQWRSVHVLRMTMRLGVAHRDASLRLDGILRERQVSMNWTWAPVEGLPRAAVRACAATSPSPDLAGRIQSCLLDGKPRDGEPAGVRVVSALRRARKRHRHGRSTGRARTARHPAGAVLRSRRRLCHDKGHRAHVRGAELARCRSRNARPRRALVGVDGVRVAHGPRPIGRHATGRDD